MTHPGTEGRRSCRRLSVKRRPWQPPRLVAPESRPSKWSATSSPHFGTAGGLPPHRAGDIHLNAGRLITAAEFPEVAQASVAAAVADPLDAQPDAGLCPLVIALCRGQGPGLWEVPVKAPQQRIGPGPRFATGERLFEEGEGCGRPTRQKIGGVAAENTSRGHFMAPALLAQHRAEMFCARTARNQAADGRENSAIPACRVEPNGLVIVGEGRLFPTEFEEQFAPGRAIHYVARLSPDCLAHVFGGLLAGPSAFAGGHGLCTIRPPVSC